MEKISIWAVLRAFNRILLYVLERGVKDRLR